MRKAVRPVFIRNQIAFRGCLSAAGHVLLLTLPAGVIKNRSATDVDSKLRRTRKDRSGQARFKFLGAIAEICFGGPHMCRVRHRIFVAFGKSVF